MIIYNSEIIYRIKTLICLNINLSIKINIKIIPFNHLNYNMTRRQIKPQKKIINLLNR